MVNKQKASYLVSSSNIASALWLKYRVPRKLCDGAQVYRAGGCGNNALVGVVVNVLHEADKTIIGIGRPMALHNNLIFW